MRKLGTVEKVGTDTAIAEGLDTDSEVSWKTGFVEDKLEFDWLGCREVEGQASHI